MRLDRTGMSRNPSGAVSRGWFFSGLGVIRDVCVSVIAIASFFLIFPMGCGEKTGKGASAVGGESPRRLRTSESLLAEGDEVFLDARTASMVQATAAAPAAGGMDGRGRWSLMLVTVGGNNHPMQAQAIRGEIIRTFPELHATFVRSSSKGSTIWYGRFKSAIEPAAKQTRERIKALQRNGQPAFPRAFFSVLPDDSPIGDRDIRRLRSMYPGVNPLYSLQIACWGTFGGDQITWDEVRRAAEAKVAALRARGFDAWYHHDPVTELSVVTVGVFDSRAYDGRSTLFSPEVESLLKDFPIHLINGEDVIIEIRPGDPSTRVPQQCRLVSVPELP
jgi:hypothetical protein